MGFARQSGVRGRLATDRPVVAKFYGAYRLPFGTQVGGFDYAGSGTPMSTVVNTTNTIPVFVNGRGDMGRTPALTRTDLLVSHEVSMMGNRRVRFELNVINLFNQKTATHIFNALNKGSGLRARSVLGQIDCRVRPGQTRTLVQLVEDVRRRLLVEQVQHVELEPHAAAAPHAHSCEISRSVRVSVGVRPMSPRPSTKTGLLFVVLTTVVIGVPLPA